MYKQINIPARLSTLKALPIVGKRHENFFSFGRGRGTALPAPRPPFGPLISVRFPISVFLWI